MRNIPPRSSSGSPARTAEPAWSSVTDRNPRAPISGSQVRQGSSARGSSSSLPSKASPKRTIGNCCVTFAAMTTTGTRSAPWILKTPPLSSEFEAFRDEALEPPALVVRVGKTELRYHLRCVDDLRAMLQAHGDWMPLGAADEQKPAGDGTVEAWARAADNPVGGWYGLKKGLRGRF